MSTAGIDGGTMGLDSWMGECVGSWGSSDFSCFSNIVSAISNQAFWIEGLKRTKCTCHCMPFNGYIKYINRFISHIFGERIGCDFRPKDRLCF